ncbi:MAG: hypothetical protein JWP08_3838 [Bryobacterales bacterium]|nr:hypothetical protein [Bryobacterales bacterium]
MGVSWEMSDPRNVAHDKKVKQEKEHHELAAGAASKAKKRKRTAKPNDVVPPTTAAEVPKAEQAPGELEKSLTVLSKLKDMEFHSRANIETLAQLSLTIEDELKQKEFSNPVGEIYSAQDGFQTKLLALIESYGAKCESLKPSS